MPCKDSGRSFSKFLPALSASPNRKPSASSLEIRQADSSLYPTNIYVLFLDGEQIDLTVPRMCTTLAVGVGI